MCDIFSSDWIHTRRDWGARPARGVLVVKRFTRIAIHYSTGQELGRADIASWVRSIQLDHQVNRGWSDIGYNFLISADGHVWEGRGWSVLGAHCPGRNSDSLGVCFLGNDDPGVNDLTPEAKLAIKYLIEEFRSRYGEPVEIFPHRRYKATACPGDEITAWIAGGLKL